MLNYYLYTPKEKKLRITYYRTAVIVLMWQKIIFLNIRVTSVIQKV